MKANSSAKFLIPLVSALVLFPPVSAALALAAGVVIAVWLGNPYPTKMYTSNLLTWSVIGLGAGMNLETVARVGMQGLGYTVVSIVVVFIMGFFLQKVFRVEEEVSTLITVGTAICGGSAIAAVAPVLRAKPHSVSVALGTVFILNALALIVFPEIGHFFQMSERAFGLWSALAIHDTSSVVGASVSYGKIAAEVGTTVKLARALWIVPVVLAIGLFRKVKAGEATGPTKKPWFILGFVLMAALVTWVPSLQETGHFVEFLARRLLVLTLFFIGLGLSKENLKKVGFRPFLMGVTLWVLVLAASFVAIESGVIS